jgi:alcohol dehydrogenase (NADP+)
MERLANLLRYGKLDVKPLLTHRLDGFEQIERALLMMRDKPRDLIKPVISI